MWLTKAHTSQEAPTSTSRSSSLYLINKYCIDDLKGELLDIVKNKFAPKYIFSKFSYNSKMTKEDADLYSIIIHECI